VRVIYIAGLGHSGSTFLELLLASHPGVVGLGEIGLQVEMLLQNDPASVGKEACSCGVPWSECAFWGELVATHWTDAHEVYESVFARFEKMFPGMAAADSSKGFRHLERYAGTNLKNDVRALLIIRDYRGWALSRSNTNEKKQRSDHGYVLNCYRWMFSTARLIRSLSKTQEFVYLAYEDLVFNPEVVLPETCEALDLAFEDSMMEDAPKAHNVLGNGMRKKFQKTRKVQYDHSWMTDPRVTLLGLLVFPVHLYQALQRWWLERRSSRQEVR
jgi:hypothetical protein